MEYLEFELPIKELEDQLQKCEIIGKESDVDVTETCQQIQTKLELAKKEIYKNLSPWQRVQLSRHPNSTRPLRSWRSPNSTWST